MKRFPSVISWLGFLFLFLFGVYYSLSRIYSGIYLDSLFASGLSMLLGVAIGIPVALQIDRWRSGSDFLEENLFYFKEGA